jgi:hypothetical protein
MTKYRSNRRKIAQGAAGTQFCGSDREDRWWLLLSRQIGKACDRFWQATPERQQIEAERKRKSQF